LVLGDVAKRFGGVEALSGVSLAVERGEIVGLVGPNGSGKTTLLNVIGGLDRAESGTITLDAAHLELLPPHAIARRGLGRSFQSNMLPGEARSAGLARAISTDAAFLLLDEPAAGATDREREELASLLRRLRDAARGVVIVDHDIDLLARVCDRLICLDRGKVIAVGRPADVRANPDVRASFLGLEEAVA
jgi:branched-chain amino acid transport system permease protein